MRGVLVARATGLMSALRAPFSCFPDPGLSARCHAAFISPGIAALPGGPPEVQGSFLRASRALFRLFGGTRRIRRCWEPA
ncbi:hypothetical protein [Sabulicella rubraurantiaca]|uniref:hypothetical protein n=1 Tax=Sabulicella rubraurantiaca TaxID=2811429 RepID=UPI001A973608|nr:hypothetical protein [Sabulicella rubraurantiaca]